MGIIETIVWPEPLCFCGLLFVRPRVRREIGLLLYHDIKLVSMHVPLAPTPLPYAPEVDDVTVAVGKGENDIFHQTTSC